MDYAGRIRKGRSDLWGGKRQSGNRQRMKRTSSNDGEQKGRVPQRRQPIWKTGENWWEDSIPSRWGIRDYLRQHWDDGEAVNTVRKACVGRDL